MRRAKVCARWFDSTHPRMPADAPSVKARRRQNAIDQPERCKQSGKPIRSAAAATGHANGTTRARKMNIDSTERRRVRVRDTGYQICEAQFDSASPMVRLLTALAQDHISRAIKSGLRGHMRGLAMSGKEDKNAIRPHLRRLCRGALGRNRPGARMRALCCSAGRRTDDLTGSGDKKSAAPSAGTLEAAVSPKR